MSTSPYLSDDPAAITAAALDTAQPSPSTSNMPLRSASDILSGNTDSAQPSPDTTGMPTNTRTAVANPVTPIAPKHGFMSDLLHALGEVLGGPSTVQRVNPTTGAVEDVPLSRAGRIANTTGIYLRGAAAGAAQHGPAAAGKAALAGATEQQQFQQQQQENTLAQSRNVRETNAAEQEKQMNAARLSLMSQQAARLGIDVKAAQLEFDQNQLGVINALQKNLNRPGVKLLQHFDSNSEINDHLESIGPELAKQRAINLANNDIQLFVSPKGGFDAVEIPKDAGDKAIGPGMKVHRVTIDPKTNQLALTAEDADPNMTWDKYNGYEAAALNAYNGNQKFQQDLKEGLQRIRTQKSEETKNYAEAAAATANAGSKNDELAVAYDPTYQNSDGTKGANVVMPKGQARQNNLQHYKADPSTINATVAGFNDVQTKLNQLADVANNPDSMSQVQSGLAAAMLAHGKGIEVGAFGTKVDTSRVNEELYKDDVASANQATKDYVTAMVAAHEAITQLPRLQTFGKSNRMTQQQMEAAQNMLPQPGDDPALAQQKMQSLQTTIDPLRKQLPHMQGAELLPTWLEKGQGAQKTTSQTAQPAATVQPFKGAGAIYNPPKGIVLHGIWDPNSKRIKPVPAGGQ